MNFGTIKNIYAKNLIESYITESKKLQDKEKYKEFIKTISESPILKTQFIVYKNIENGYFTSEVSAVEYLKENISLFDTFNKKDIVKENKKLTEKLVSSYGKNSLKEKVKELHEAIENLIILEKNIETINQLHESFEVIKKWLTTPKTISESTTTKPKVDANKFLNIVVDKYNGKYSNISEEEKRIIKTILSENNEEKETLLKNMIKESISLINSSLKEYGDSIEVKSKLLEAKDVIYSLEFNPKSFKEDILKIYDLKNSLS